MKISIIFIIFCSLWLLSKGEIKIKLPTNQFSELAAALNLIIEKYFLKNAVTVNLIAPDQNFHSLEDFKQELLMKHLANVSLAIKQDDSTELKKNTVIKRRGVNILIRDFDDFQEIYSEISSEIFKLNTYYFIVMLHGEIKEIEEIFKLLLEKQIYNVLAMFDDKKGSIQIKTFNPFNEDKCNDYAPVRINEFRAGKFTNGTENLFAKKMKNLYKCPITVATTNNSEPHIFLKKLENGAIDITGRDISLINTVAELLNFTVEFTYIGTNSYIFENGSAGGVYEAVLTGIAQIVASNFMLRESRLKFFDRTTSHVSESLVFSVPPGSELSSAEIMVYPFKYHVWIVILVIFSCGLLVIFIVQFQSKKIQDLVFGADNKTPYLNMIVAAYGGSQKKLPRKSFARILLMLFLMYSLIIRVTYQGSFYKLLRSNQQHSEVQSLQEMIDNNFTFFASYASMDLLNATEALRDK